MLTTIVTILFAILATVTPSDIPIRFEILGPSATYTNTESMFDALPTESPQAAQEPQRADYDYHVYLPMSSRPIPDTRITADQIRNATGAGFSYLDWMTGRIKDPGKLATHEYPAMPVWLLVDNSGVYMPGLPGVTVSWFHVGPIRELSTLDFDINRDGVRDFQIWADREYTQDGPTQYQFTVATWNPNYSTGGKRFDLRMGDYQIFDNLNPAMVGDTMNIITDKPQPSLRYTLRHASRLGYNLFSTLGEYDNNLRDGLNNTLTSYGFTVDLYDPIFGIKNNIDPRAYASGQAVGPPQSLRKVDRKDSCNFGPKLA